MSGDVTNISWLRDKLKLSDCEFTVIDGNAGRVIPKQRVGIGFSEIPRKFNFTIRGRPRTWMRRI
jgi:hypothetical protein